MTVPGIYRHFKGGLYRVLFTAIDAENGQNDQLVVVYVSLKNGLIFVRSEKEFSERVPHPADAGMSVPRFALEGEQ